ncbi:MAG TPA: hypothetical protein VLS89_05120 [Candidatus Nanopelagicales bacterium]|nr:hypothetical protein [Candidatus Nanopelagicales bacterium]
MTIFRICALPLAAVFVVSTLVAGCGGDDDGGAGGGSSSDCGTLSSPTVLELRDVTPAAGETVQNGGIVHAFTVVSAPGLFQSIALALGSEHTAGTPDPSSVQVSAQQEGQDIRYEAEPMTWATAPGRVELGIPTVYQDSEGCVYAFPSPLFSYEVEAGGGGAGGGAGGGGAGGAGGGG